MHVQIIGLLIIKDNDLLSQNVTPTHSAPKQCLCYTLAIYIFFKTQNAFEQLSLGSAWVLVSEEGESALHSAGNIFSQTFVIQVWVTSTSLTCRLCLLGSFLVLGFFSVAAGVFPDAPVETTAGLKNY